MSNKPVDSSVSAMSDLRLFNQLEVVRRLIKTWSGPHQELHVAETYEKELETEIARRTGLDGTEPKEGFAVIFIPQGGVTDNTSQAG